MKSYEDNLMDFEPIQNKNSKSFDLQLLGKLKQIQCHPRKFETEVRKIMREKSSCKLWYSSRPTREWDVDKLTVREVDFRCCPSSRRVNYFFCLILDRENDLIKVKDGFLTAV